MSEQDPTATVEDIRIDLDTDLDDPEIQGVLDRTVSMIYRVYDPTEFIDETHRRDFESVLTALRIATGRDRQVSRWSLGTATKTYETNVVTELESRVRLLDPGDEFATGGVRRNTNRYSRTTNPRSRTELGDEVRWRDWKTP